MRTGAFLKVEARVEAFVLYVLKGLSLGHSPKIVCGSCKSSVNIVRRQSRC